MDSLLYQDRQASLYAECWLKLLHLDANYLHYYQTFDICNRKILKHFKLFA